MNFELKTVVASEDGKFPQIKLLSDQYRNMTAYYGSRIFEGCNINGSMNACTRIPMVQCMQQLIKEGCV
jgi:hypothetical protein